MTYDCCIEIENDQSRLAEKVHDIDWVSMFSETFELGSSPADEDCAQINAENYTNDALFECKIYKSQLLRMYKSVWGCSPRCDLVIKGNSHDFGTYYEVVAVSSTLEGLEDLLWFDSNLPQKWDEAAKKELQERVLSQAK